MNTSDNVTIKSRDTVNHGYQHVVYWTQKKEKDRDNASVLMIERRRERDVKVGVRNDDNSNGVCECSDRGKAKTYIERDTRRVSWLAANTRGREVRGEEE